ncbi:Secretion system effector C (SseC) like family protein [compost metagenome]
MMEINPLLNFNNPLPGVDLAGVSEPQKRSKINSELVVSYSGSSAPAKAGQQTVRLDAPAAQVGGGGNLQAAMAALAAAGKACEHAKGVFKSLGTGEKVVDAEPKRRYSSIDGFAIDLMGKMKEINESQSKNSISEIENTRLANQEEMKANDEKLQASLKAGTEAKKSGLAARIFGWISAVAAIIVGAVMVATGAGAVAGALMIAGGVLGVVSCALQECAKAGLISKEAMAVIGPIVEGLAALAAAASAIFSFGGSLAALMAKKFADLAPKIAQMAEKVASTLSKVAQIGTKVASASGTFTNGLLKTAVPAGDLLVNTGKTITEATNQGLNADAAYKQGDLLKSRTELEAQQALMDKLTQALQQLFEEFQRTFDALTKLLAGRSNTQHNLARSPKTI